MTAGHIAWRTYDDLIALCRAAAARARELDVDAIVGIPRSGMLAASALALALGLPLSDVRSFCARRTWGFGDRDTAECTARRILLVDDSCGTGKAMQRSLARLACARPGVTVLTCAAYATPRAARSLTLALEVLPKPRLFEWNWWRHGLLDQCCVDIDGVLCRDPTRDELRDPDAYLRFLEHAPAIVSPTQPIGALVTGRREAYRSVTEAWMARRGITYRALKMLDRPCPRTAAGHAEHKAAFYASFPASLFIESDPQQAELIARLTGKDTLCITTRTLHPWPR